MYKNAAKCSIKHGEMEWQPIFIPEIINVKLILQLLGNNLTS